MQSKLINHILKKLLSLLVFHGIFHKEESHAMNDSQDEKLKVVIDNKNNLFDFYIGTNAGGRMMGYH